MNKAQTGLYVVISLTIIGAIVNAIIPFVSPVVASILVVASGFITAYLHPQAVSNAVASATRPKL